MRTFAAFLACVLASSAFASGGEKLSLGESAEHAVQQSKITLPGSKPFHLKAEIIETTNPKSDYQAKVDEYWVSQNKWRRTIESPGFSQTLVVNGDKVLEQDKGAYLPWWLNDLITAMLDPLPMLEDLKQIQYDLRMPEQDGAISCADLHTEIDRSVFCFQGRHGLLESALTRGYDAEFRDYRRFGDKTVARRIVIDPEPGTTIRARITELSELSQPDDSMFTVQTETPTAERIRSLKVDENEFRKLAVGSVEINWPVVGGGMSVGRCAVYASADRAGHIQEVWPGGCDNPGLQDPLREIVSKWQLKPAVAEGAPVQVESLLTFRFEAKIVKSDAVLELSNAEARELATNIVDPCFPPGSVEKGVDVAIRISVDETGKLAGIENSHGLSNTVFSMAMAAVNQWDFRPLMRNGKPQYFHADIVFHVCQNQAAVSSPRQPKGLYVNHRAKSGLRVGTAVALRSVSSASARPS